MRTHVRIALVVSVMAAVLLAGCAPKAAATMAPAEQVYATVAPVQAEPQAEAEQPAAPTAAPLATAVDENAGLGALGAGTQRMIIKNAEVKLLVANTDVAIDRLTQVVGDLGGYIISSRVWYEPYGVDNAKYATITMGVPVEQFEPALRRLRELAVRVLDENASGQDVTNEYVDLASRLRNLELTRDRIRGFLDQTTTVSEALTINEELTKVEGQIEEVQGRMQYLSGRAAYSTITVSLEPDLPELTPTPTPTPTATPTPTPLPPLEPWHPGDTFSRAGRAFTQGARTAGDTSIWFVVTVLPCIAPIILAGWVIWVLARRKGRKPKAAAAPPQKE